MESTRDYSIPAFGSGCKSVTFTTVLPSIVDARLPASYERAKVALAECSRIDECQEWADKAEALASYARQAKDEGLRLLSDRIQARAIRRCGELLKTFDPKPGARTDLGTETTRGSAAEDAGLSERQRKTALRVASVPADEFETAIESDNPPTVTALAEAGKRSRPLVNLHGRDPKDFSVSTDGQAQLRQLAEFAKRTDPAIVIRGALLHERKSIREHIAVIDTWLDQLIVSLAEER